ncbi:hypothetical protein CJU90_4087 [Yarrowia sp. C11]|nr:hypothetical protein CKK34_5696 [Yarrowia sp. E02]KAG5367780.1 hypothetical protein CJU90_4087 [Yarrowia sp. C11]
MLDRARDKRPYDTLSENNHNTRYHRHRPRDSHSLFIDPYLRRVTDQAYVLERGQEIDVTKQVERLRFLLDVDRDGDGNFWEQKWSSFGVVHDDGSRGADEEEEDHVTDDEEDHVTDDEDHMTLNSSSETLSRAILLMDRCVDAKDRCLKINDFWGKYGLSFKDQINFIYTTCFYVLIREVAMNANRIISQLFEEDETKVRRKFKRQRAHRLWEMGDWLVKRGAEMAAQRGIHVTHNPSVKPDDVVSSIVAVVSYMEFVVINYRPYQTQTRINYGFEKRMDESGGGHVSRDTSHVRGDASNPVHKAAASLWTPWAVASCNPLAIADPEKAEEFSSFDFRYEDVFKKKKDECECGVALFP